MDASNSTIVIDTVSKIFACICIIESIAGVILNPLVLIICLKSRRLRSTSTFKILAVSAINDMIVSIPWNQDDFAITMFGHYSAYESLFYCEWISVFLQNATLNIETWILLSISVDRLLSMVVKKWSKFYFTGCRPYIFTVLLCLVISALNFHESFTSGYIYVDNETQLEIVECYATGPNFSYDWYGFVEKFALYFGFLIPIGFLFIVNFLIIYKATQYSRSHKAYGNGNTSTASHMRSHRKKTQMTKMILFVTFFYIALTLPEEIYSGYFFDSVSELSFGQMITNIIDAVQFAYPSFHIVILYFSNKQFAQEVKEIILRIKSSRVATSSILGNTNSSSLNDHRRSTLQRLQRIKSEPMTTENNADIGINRKESQKKIVFIDG